MWCLLWTNFLVIYTVPIYYWQIYQTVHPCINDELSRCSFWPYLFMCGSVSATTLVSRDRCMKALNWWCAYRTGSWTLSHALDYDEVPVCSGFIAYASIYVLRRTEMHLSFRSAYKSSLCFVLTSTRKLDARWAMRWCGSELLKMT